jgi:hypothetical protein
MPERGHPHAAASRAKPASHNAAAPWGCLSHTTLQRRGASRRAAAPVEPPAVAWPGALLEHPAVCEDPAVLLRLLATGRALGDEAAAAAAGRLRRLTLGREGLRAFDLKLEGSYDDFFDDPFLDDYEKSKSRKGGARVRREDCKQLCREQAAFVERRGALLAELVVAEASVWHSPGPLYSDHEDRPIERVLAPALQRAAATGRLAGLRAVEIPSFVLEGGLLGALALCPALTRLHLGIVGQQRYDRCCVSIGGGGAPSVEERRAFGCQLAALRGLQELDLALGCEPPAAPALAGLSALTRLTRLRLTLVGNIDEQSIEMTRQWCGLHLLPTSLEDLTLAARIKVRAVSGPGRKQEGGG